MKTIVFMRHAKSSWNISDGITDEQRPLNKRGKRDAPEIGRRFKAKKFKIKMIVSSTALRALMTAEYVADAMNFTRVQIFESFYSFSKSV